MKKTMRDSHAVFGGELSGHFYYRDNFYADSGMITLVHILNILSKADRPISELIKPLRRYAASGEINFRIEDKNLAMQQRANTAAARSTISTAAGAVPRLVVQLRPSNTEPLLRLNVKPKPPNCRDKLADPKTSSASRKPLDAGRGSTTVNAGRPACSRCSAMPAETAWQ